MAIQIVLVHSVDFHIIMQHLNNICLNFHCKILKIERLTVNLRRLLEKKLFCGVHHNSQQINLKKKSNFKTIGPVDFELWCTRTSKITSFRKTCIKTRPGATDAQILITLSILLRSTWNFDTIFLRYYAIIEKKFKKSAKNKSFNPPPPPSDSFNNNIAILENKFNCNN